MTYQNMMKKISVLIFTLFLLHGCSSVNTFPTLARAGDTVSLLMGGSEFAKKDTTDVILTDVNGLDWDLKALGKVRSVFNIRMDAKSVGQNYSSYIDLLTSWAYGHELLQTVLVVDLPNNLPVGPAVVEVNSNTSDNSALLSPGSIFVNIEIVPGVGSSDSMSYKTSLGSTFAADFSRLEAAPYAKIDFGELDDFTPLVGAISLVVDFDETVINPDDINIYLPKSTVRGDLSTPGKFGKNQRMVYWRQDGKRVFIDIIAPQGINPGYLNVFLIHPPGISGNPNFTILNINAYTESGANSILTANLNYYP